MRVLEHPSQLRTLNLPHVICTLGVFDGVHLGHQKIMGTVVQTAKESKGTSVVVTFDKHPYNVLNPSVHICLLTNPAHKLQLIESIGVDVCIMMKFDKTISNIPAETWIKEILWNDMHIEAIYLGEDSFFGKDARGDVNLLSEWGKQLGFKVIKMDLLRTEKAPINSTTIRNLITSGDLLSAQKFLGRLYSIFGTPIKGSGKGKEIGFPTINLDTQDLCLPPNGVYAVWVDKKIPAVANLGIRPTFSNIDKKSVLEVHLLTPLISEAKVLEVIFIKKLRDEIRFTTASELSSQIENDIAKAKKIFSTLL